MMDIGFNIIETGNTEIFDEKLSIIEFLRKISKEERLPYNCCDRFGYTTLLCRG